MTEESAPRGRVDRAKAWYAGQPKGKKWGIGCGGCLGLILIALVFLTIIGLLLQALGVAEPEEVVEDDEDQSQEQVDDDAGEEEATEEDEPAEEESPAEDEAVTEEEDEEDDSTVEVPDVIGMPGDEARVELSDAGFDVTFEAEESAVVNPANWEVESTDPEAGEDAAEGDEVTVHVVRPEGYDDEQDEGEAGAAEEGDEELREEDPDDYFEFSTSEYNNPQGQPVREVLVQFDIGEHFTTGMARTKAERDTFEAIQAAAEEHPDYDRIAINAYGPTVDEYGNEDSSLLVIAAYDRETVEQINFDNPHMVDIWELRDAGGGCMPALC